MKENLKIVEFSVPHFKTGAMEIYFISNQFSLAWKYHFCKVLSEQFTLQNFSDIPSTFKISQVFIVSGQSAGCWPLLSLLLSLLCVHHCPRVNSPVTPSNFLDIEIGIRANGERGLNWEPGEIFQSINKYQFSVSRSIKWTAIGMMQIKQNFEMHDLRSL